MSFASMDGISSTPIENSVEFLRLRDKYKSDLLDDSRLTKAAGLAAKKELLLESAAPDTWKEPRLRTVNRELQQWVKKIRQPGGTRGITSDQDVSDEEDGDEGNLAVGPFHQFMGNISKLGKALKRQAEPILPLLDTPPLHPLAIKPPPSTGQQAKRFLPKTPKKSPFSSYKTVKKPPLSGYKASKKTPLSGYKTSKKAKPPSPASSVFDTADEDIPITTPLELAAALPFAEQVGDSPWISPTEKAGESIKSIKRALRKLTSEQRKDKGLQQSATKPPPSASMLTRAQRRAQRRALKKLEPAPGWKPFGTPTQRKLDGQDW